jgi:hypothetical protein
MSVSRLPSSIVWVLSAFVLSACGAEVEELRYGKGVFEAPHPWTKDIGSIDRSADSDMIIEWLDRKGGWGAGEMRIDFSMALLTADEETQMVEFTPTDDFYEPDCDHVPFPLPLGGVLEGEEGYECTQDGDCHLLVVHEAERKVYEMWRANIVDRVFYGGCTAVWDLDRAYPDTLRGDGCTSADAAGFPISAMLFSAEEVAAGSIDHAVRFVLPNDRIREDLYVRPATHATSATSGSHIAPPYGVRLRLRADFPVDDLPSEGARVIGRALQRYGMFLADGGAIALTGETDRFSAVKWADVGVDAFSLSSIQVSDMEVVDMAEPVEGGGDCVRNTF